MSNGDTIVQMYRNSGKDYNDYGRMDDCEAHPEFDYLLGSVTTERIFPIPISMGIAHLIDIITSSLRENI